MEIDKKLMHDVQMLVSRLVEKAPQLIDNFTTNLAEAWIHVGSKFDGGKVSIAAKVDLGNIVVQELGYSTI